VRHLLSQYLDVEEEKSSAGDPKSLGCATLSIPHSILPKLEEEGVELENMEDWKRGANAFRVAPLPSPRGEIIRYPLFSTKLQIQ